MINFESFVSLHNIYPEKTRPFLAKSCKEASRKNFKGLKILQNIPLTIEAVLKIEPLLIAGADLTVSCITSLQPHKKAIDILKAANVKVNIEHNFTEQYDIHLDCCGELADNIAPRIGSIELTQTGTNRYKELNPKYPVISVDDCDLKYLEALYGTGDGYIRAIKKNTDIDLHNKKFIVFGCGKIGKGVINAVLRYSDNIFVIDPDESALNFATARGIKSSYGKNISQIKSEIKDAHFVVTATGIKDLLTDYYQLEKLDFGNAILANMGAEDEYGSNFSSDDVLFDKMPLNFSLEQPTQMKYLDPILYAHNKAIDILLSNNTTKTYQSFPQKEVNNILMNWAKFHDENIDLLLSSTNKK